MTTENSRADAVAIVEKEADYWSRGHYYEGTRNIVRALPGIQKLPVGSKLYVASPVEQPAAAPRDAMLQSAHTLEQIAKMVDRVLSADVVRDLCRIAQQFRTLATREAQPAPSPADERAAWQTGVPPVKEGSYAGFIVACRRKYSGEVYVFEANYANQYAEELRDDDGEEFTAHGWYDVVQDIHGEYSSIFSKTCGEGDEIVGWQQLPKWSDEARAASANETGAEGGGGSRSDSARACRGSHGCPGSRMTKTRSGARSTMPWLTGMKAKRSTPPRSPRRQTLGSG